MYVGAEYRSDVETPEIAGSVGEVSAKSSEAEVSVREIERRDKARLRERD
jgi:hypothetical protein